MLTVLGIVAFAASAVLAVLGLDELGQRRRVATLKPTKVRALRRGIVAVEGRVRARKTSLGPLTRSPCAWYRMTVVAGDGSTGQIVEERVANELFVLEDDTGSVLVDPVGMSINLERRYHEDDQRGRSVTSEWRLDEGQHVVIIGTARTMRDIASARARAHIRRVRDLQNDPARFARFEVDAKGQLTDAGRDAMITYLRRELRADEPAVALGASDLVLAEGHARAPFTVTDGRKPVMPRPPSPVRGLAFALAGAVGALLSLLLLLG
jgi:hypothetical protein